MLETWRWFGPLDDIRLDEVRQTSAAGIVTVEAICLGLSLEFGGEPAGS